jgi:AsmA protein
MAKINFKGIFIKGAKYIGITISIIIAILLIFPIFFKNQISREVKILANQHLKGEINFDSINLSFFEHFPVFTATVKHLEIKGSAPFEKITLLKTKGISLGIDLKSLLSNQIVIDRFYLDDAAIHVQVDSTGLNNYNILKERTDAADKKGSETATNLAIKEIRISNSSLHYNDKSIPLTLNAAGLNYVGYGDLMSTLIDLQSKADIKSFSMSFNGESYIDQKSIRADLLTKINTNTLAFIFERNELKINELPIKFRGEFGFLSNGYHLDFKVKTHKSTLANMLSILPPAYEQWTKDTRVSGEGEAFMSLKGSYIATENIMPALNIGLKLQNGLIAYKNTNAPIENLNMGLKVNLPDFNLDSLKINLETLSFQIAKGDFNAKINSQGLSPLFVNGSVHADLDLGAFHQALGIQKFDLKGLFKMDAKVDGKYATAIKHSGVRKIDTVISSIPTFNINSSLSNGYFKFAALKQPISLIAFNFKAMAKDSLIKSATIAFNDIHLKALSNYIKGNLNIQDLRKLKLNAQIQSSIDLSTLKDFYPMPDVDLKGNLAVNFNAAGQLDPKRNIFPITHTDIKLNRGYIKSYLYAVPVEAIEIQASVKSAKGSLRDLKVDVLPISFKIANEPFFLRANLENFNNIKYNVVSKGTLNLEPFYKIFGIEGLNLNGFVNTDFSLAGLQSDASKGRYHHLKHKGTIEINNININSDMFPYPFYFKNGKFTFHRHYIKFDQITSQYKGNQLTLNGYVNNYISYITSPTAPLRGQMTFNSQKLDINDFMAYAAPTPTYTQTNEVTGVVLIPENLDIQLNTQIKQVHYNKLLINNFNGTLGIQKGKLNLAATKFDLAGMAVNMNGSYSPIHTKRAKFDYNIEANDFDIQKAYHEIPLFKEMVSSARNAHGNISLSYSLSGLLDAGMQPVLPSLAGKGKLVLENIKFKGFKLLNNIAKTTDHDKLNDAAVSKVTINTAIKNNVMTIERTKMKVALLRPRFEGQVSLDGKMNIGFRLGLPPFGIFGVPLTITGTPDNHKIKLGKYKEAEMDLDMDDDDKKLYEAEQALKQDSAKVSNVQSHL